MFNNDTTADPDLAFTTTNSQLTTQAESKRVLAGQAVSSIQNIANGLNSDYAVLDSGLTQTENELKTISGFLDILHQALNAAAGLSQTAINTYKGYVNTARANIDSALSGVRGQIQTITAQKAANQQNIDSAQASVNSSQNALSLAQDELTLLLAGSSQEAISAQQAKLKLYSPISGIVVKQEAKKGEVISANTNIVSINSLKALQIEANIVEVDIAKLKIGNLAQATLDAFGDEVVFQARVVSIDPAETIVEGVATYKTTLEFMELGQEVKSGMTANLDIETNRQENVLAVPYRAIVEKNGQKFVRLLFDGDEIEEIAVETGLRASDGNVEIVSGLQPGDKVITYLEEK